MHTNNVDNILSICDVCDIIKNKGAYCKFDLHHIIRMRNIHQHKGAYCLVVKLVYLLVMYYIEHREYFCVW